MLNNVVVGLEGRIDQLEKNMSEIKEILTKLDSRVGDTSFLTPATWLPESTAPDLSTHTSVSSSSTPTSHSRCAAMRPGRFRLIHRADGSQQYVGPTSLDSLIDGFARSVVAPLCQTNFQHSLSQDQLTFARDRLFALVGLTESYQSVRDLSATTIPPLGILEPMIDPYFDNINQLLPIWSKDRFREFIASSQLYTPGLPRTAHMTCFNSLVILILTTKLASVSRQSETSMPGWGSTDLDLVKYFLKNAMRAVDNIYELMTLHLTNVQALLYLHLVAQIHWGPERASLFLNLASAGAKQLGLYQWDSSQGYSLQEASERQRVLLCLYTLDKSRCWVDGHPPHVPLWRPDACLSLQAIDPVLAARVRLRQIEEKIFIKLYSDTSGDQTTKQTEQLVACLFQELRKFETDHAFNDSVDQKLSFMAAELKIVACALRVFLYWKAGAEHALMTTSTRCISLFVTLWRQDAEVGNHLTVIRLLVGYASLSFFQLCSFVLLNQTAGSADPAIEVLASFLAMLQSISRIADTNIPIKKLTETGAIVLGLCSGQSVTRAEWSESLHSNHIVPSHDSLLQMHQSLNDLDPLSMALTSAPMISTIAGTSAPTHSFGFENSPSLLSLLDPRMFTIGDSSENSFADVDLQRWASELQGSGAQYE
ncbi:hypothetical protein KAF25_008745 [Fusarium avenaceum]|uniref:Xylanolytic transcriptional activator regulatory domain-containing protein n=1 Tax=Fusarium avenaceum TaxID=40199 RepID=A0A9P7KZY1_9HYPO|nr:hypothetical protein KAF25_008745 [Fusarium avenaceum]